MPVSSARKKSKSRFRSKIKSTILFDRKTIKILKRGIIVFVLVIISVGFFGGLTLYRTLNKSLAGADSSVSFDIKNQDIISLLLVSLDNSTSTEPSISSLNFLVFDITMKKVVVFELPLELETDLPGRFGNEKYKNVYSLGALEGKSLEAGMQLVKETVKKDFAFNVDRILVLRSDLANKILNTFSKGKGAEIFSYDVLSGILFDSQTNLNASEFYYLYSFVTSLTLDRFILHNEGLAYYQNESFTDTILRDLTFDSQIAEESSSFAILNGTSIDGVASFGSRLVQNLGGHVIATDNSQISYEKSILVTDLPESFSVRALKRYFNVEKTISKSEYYGSDTVLDRADVTLIIGFDIAQSL